jgi:hypothetical protein
MVLKCVILGEIRCLSLGKYKLNNIITHLDVRQII